MERVDFVARLYGGIECSLESQVGLRGGREHSPC